ncbi:MAG: hypothetical protein IKE75_02645 [Bacilli bacterium]|nr:hypothetical protein [Bacilli bacterium]
MRKLRRDKFKNQRKIVVASLVAALFFLVSGYAAFQTNIKLNAKGNLVKSGVTFGGITVNLAQSGDGLYEDPIEQNEYIYKGSNPNNYIRLGSDLYRIVSVDSSGNIKVIKNDSIGNMAWDSDYDYDSLDWDKPVTLNTYLNSTFYNSLSSNLKGAIINHQWNIGVVYNSSPLASVVTAEKQATYTNKIALTNLSDFLKVNTNCTNNYLCATSGNSYWTLTPFEEGELGAWLIASSGPSVDVADSSYKVRPSFYLNSLITLSGQGTSSNPYTVTSWGSGGGGSSTQTVYAYNTAHLTTGTATLQDLGTTSNSCAGLGKNVCLKYTLESNTVTSVDLCFVHNSTEYCLISADGGAAYNTNKNTLNTAFGSSACEDPDGNDESYECFEDDWDIVADTGGSSGGSSGIGNTCWVDGPDSNDKYIVYCE